MICTVAHSISKPIVTPSVRIASASAGFQGVPVIMLPTHTSTGPNFHANSFLKSYMSYFRSLFNHGLGMIHELFHDSFLLELRNHDLYVFKISNYVSLDDSNFPFLFFRVFWPPKPFNAMGCQGHGASQRRRLYLRRQRRHLRRHRLRLAPLRRGAAGKGGFGSVVPADRGQDDAWDELEATLKGVKREGLRALTFFNVYVNKFRFLIRLFFPKYIKIRQRPLAQFASPCDGASETLGGCIPS